MNFLKTSDKLTRQQSGFSKLRSGQKLIWSYDGTPLLIAGRAHDLCPFHCPNWTCFLESYPTRRPRNVSNHPAKVNFTSGPKLTENHKLGSVDQEAPVLSPNQPSFPPGVETS